MMFTPHGPRTPPLDLRSPMKIPAAAAVALLLAPLAAQGDTVRLVSGTVVEDASVQGFTIRELRYRKGGSPQSVPADQVAGIELGRFRDVYRRGLADRGDPDLLLETAREQLKQKNDLLAQFGFVEAARLFYQRGKGAVGGSALEELVQGIPDAGLLPEFYRLKFDNYMSRGDAEGYRNALIIARKMHQDAMTNAWPSGFALEGEFYTALAEGAASGGKPKEFQDKMRQVAARAMTTNPQLAGRANVQLAHSLRQTGDKEAAAKIYQDILAKEASDENSRAGAYLGLGLLELERPNADAEVYRKALMNFLRVRLETRNCWDSLQAEALYYAMSAADKWRGADYAQIIGRCRYILANDFAGSEWAQRAQAR